MAQTDRDFHVVVADDGSTSDTADLLAAPSFSRLKIHHVWHPDAGFRLRTIRNRAIAQADAQFLIFIDSDCIPRADFVERHRSLCPRGTFLSGARVDIPDRVHQSFTPEEILTNRIFALSYLTEREPRLARFRWRLSQRRWIEAIGDQLTWRYCVFMGSNASAWRDDLLRVNGFDESMTGYGSEDRDLGVRLMNAGVRPVYRKYSLVVLHLDHARPYLDPIAVRSNRKMFKRRFYDGTKSVPMGIDTVHLR